jgi:polysaccharide deacetylase family protein (PEP-CTERM system associated)
MLIRQPGTDGFMARHALHTHHFTVDVEEYFQVSALEPYVTRDSWDARASRVGASTRLLLEMLDQYDARGTFFVLGWLAERQPDLVHEIHNAGHEIASHGWDHRRITDITPDAFRESIRSSKALLEDLTGEAVIGFRAPSFSIVPGREWALDLLLEEGYLYDSSLFPIRRRGYGYPAAKAAPHLLRRAGGTLAEYPPTTLAVRGTNLPAAGGGYFRLFPYAWTYAAMKQKERAGLPGMFYIHPWELDPEQPRIPVPLKTRIRHYGGIRGTASRIHRLLRDFRFERTLAESLDRRRLDMLTAPLLPAL